MPPEILTGLSCGLFLGLEFRPKRLAGVDYSKWYRTVRRVAVVGMLAPFRRMFSLVLGRTCGRDALRGAFLAATACAIFFWFRGCPAIGGNNVDESAVVSILSIFAALPLPLMATQAMSGPRRMMAA